MLHQTCALYTLEFGLGSFRGERALQRNAAQAAAVKQPKPKGSSDSGTDTAAASTAEPAAAAAGLSASVASSSSRCEVTLLLVFLGGNRGGRVAGEVLDVGGALAGLDVLPQLLDDSRWHCENKTVSLHLLFPKLEPSLVTTGQQDGALEDVTCIFNGASEYTSVAGTVDMFHMFESLVKAPGSSSDNSGTDQNDTKGDGGQNSRGKNTSSNNNNNLASSSMRFYMSPTPTLRSMGRIPRCANCGALTLPGHPYGGPAGAKIGPAMREKMEMTLAHEEVAQRNNPLEWYNQTAATFFPSPTAFGRQVVYCKGRALCRCAVHYCSDECQEAHEEKHRQVCELLGEYGEGPYLHETLVYHNGAYFSVWWRLVNSTTFRILVSNDNPLGVAYELQLSLMHEAKNGDCVMLRNSVLSNGIGQKLGFQTAQEALSAINVSVYTAVFGSAMHYDQMGLAATCLNRLHVWATRHEEVERMYTAYYTTFYGGELDGSHVVTSLSSYIMQIRPLVEYTTVLIESALKASVSFQMWGCLDTAKGILINLYNYHSCIGFCKRLERIRDPLVHGQQRCTLHLLAKVFIIMASRTSESRAKRMLHRAEECYIDSIEEDKNRGDELEMARTMLKLSCLYLMFHQPETEMEAVILKKKAIGILDGLTKNGNLKAVDIRGGADPALAAALGAAVENID